MKLNVEISIEVEDGKGACDRIEAAFEEAMSLMRYDYCNAGSPYQLRKMVAENAMRHEWDTTDNGGRGDMSWGVKVECRPSAYAENAKPAEESEVR